MSCLRGRDRFAVNIKRLWLCRGCGVGGGVIDLVMHVEGLGFRDAVEWLAGEGGMPTPIREPRPAAVRDDDEDAARKSAMGLAIFDAAGTIRGDTLAQGYLALRGIDYEQIPDLDAVLRFHPQCPFDGTNKAPCLVTLVRDILSDAPRAIQRTTLDRDGCKIDRRSLGPTKGGAIKLWSDAEVTHGLVVGEGMETTAVAATRIKHRGTLLQPAWALINSAGGLAAFPVLATVEALTILVDHDASGTGQRAADACERRWLNAEREVTQFTPKIEGQDFGDIVKD